MQKEKFNSGLAVVQDSNSFLIAVRSIVKAMHKKGHKEFDFPLFRNGTTMEDYLKSIADTDDPVPDTFFLDVYGSGHKLGQFIVEWFKKHRAQLPLPRIIFSSASVGLSLRDAATFQAIYPELETGYAAMQEFEELQRYFIDRKLHFNAAHVPTRSLRQILSQRFQLDLPMAVDEAEHNFYEQSFQREIRGGALKAWNARAISAQEALKMWRPEAEHLIKNLQSGLNRLKNADIKPDAQFYTGTKSAGKGLAVFHIQDVDDWSPAKKDKPVLILKSYTPEVDELLATKRISGLVISNPYMAEHIPLLCEAYGIAGLFGFIPKDAKMTDHFNDQVKTDEAVYFDDYQADFNGNILKEGDSVYVSIGAGAGLGFTKKTVTDLDSMAKQKKPVEENPYLGAEDVATLKRCFQKYFQTAAVKPPLIKINMDSPKNAFVDESDGIGLLRSEQFIAKDPVQKNNLKAIFLGDKPEQRKALLSLENAMFQDYRSVSARVSRHQSVKIRLLDIAPLDLFTKQECRDFHARYQKPRLRGGEALEQWPELYRQQIHAIMDSCIPRLRHPAPRAPVQIMMPAVRTCDDVRAARQLVEEVAENKNIETHEYRFGIMIETLSACENAKDILPHCDFISFGTNDLSQQVLNLGRGDLKDRAAYKKQHGFDPFEQLAPEVLEKIRDVCTVARNARPNLEIEVCGNHAADAKTAFKLREAGVHNFSVAPTQANIMALPLMIKYKLFEQSDRKRAPSVKFKKP